MTSDLFLSLLFVRFNIKTVSCPVSLSPEDACRSGRWNIGIFRVENMFSSFTFVAIKMETHRVK